MKNHIECMRCKAILSDEMAEHSKHCPLCQVLEKENTTNQWISIKIPPTKAQKYRVANQYGQFADSLWNGKEWVGWANPTGNCMYYNDSTVTHWRRDITAIKSLYAPTDNLESLENLKTTKYDYMTINDMLEDAFS